MKYLSILLLALVGCTGAMAHEHINIGFGVNIGPTVVRGGCYNGSCYRPVVVYQTGHYETQVTRVILAPAITTRVLVAEVVQLTKQADGSIVRTVVSPAHYEERTVPALYEDRVYQVWVQG